jgi:hypothetical protein
MSQLREECISTCKLGPTLDPPKEHGIPKGFDFPRDSSPPKDYGAFKGRPSGGGNVGLCVCGRGGTACGHSC